MTEAQGNTDMATLADIPQVTASLATLENAPPIPHDVEAEQALLGALLYNNQRFDDVAATLKANQFYVPFHQTVFEIIGKLLNQGFEASPLTLRDELKETSYAESTDLLNHFTAMLDHAQHNQDGGAGLSSTPTTSNGT